MRGVPLTALPWLFLAALAVTLVAATPLGLAATAALLSVRVRRAAFALKQPRRAPAVLIFSLAGAAALQWVNATYYVRLYLTLHALLSLAALAFAAVGLTIALPARAAQGAALKSRTLIAALAALLGWGVVLGGSLWIVTSRHQLRAHAIDRTVLLAQELLALDALTGFLEAPHPEIEPDLSGGAATLLATRPAAPSPGGRARGKSLLLVTVDSLRADRLDNLPRLSQFAAESLQFTRAYAPSCWTIHSMTATFTSRWPSELEFANVSVDPDLSFPRRPPDDPLFDSPLAWRKVTPVPLDESHPALPELLKDAGHDTATVVPYVFYLRAAGVTRGFERIDEKAYRSHAIDGAGIAAVPMVDRALTLLDELEAPYFLWLHFMEPHAPYEARDSEAEGGGAEARYDSELRYVDREIARLLDALEARGTLDETVMAIHADHGEEFGDHGGAFHAATVYEEIVKVPLLLRVPGARPRTVDEPVTLLDLTPTLLDLLGVASAAPMRGRSLAPVAFGKAPPARPIVAECDRFGRSKRAIIEGPLKLILDRRVGTVELYDLARDPAESRNLADARPDAVRRLTALLAASRSKQPARAD